MMKNLGLLILVLGCFAFSPSCGESSERAAKTRAIVDSLKKEASHTGDAIRDIQSLSILAKDARGVGGYEGSLLSDVAIRLIAYKAIRAIGAKSVPLPTLQNALSKVPSAVPDLGTILDAIGQASGHKIDFQLPDNERLTDLILFKAAGLSSEDEWTRAASYAAKNPTISGLLRHPDAKALIQRISFTDYLMNAFIPVSIAFVRSGADIEQIDPLDVSKVERQFYDALGQQRPTLIKGEISIIALKDLTRECLSKNQPTILADYAF